MAVMRRTTAAALAVATAVGVGVTGTTSAQAAATYPPKTPTTCALTIVTGTRLNVTIGPPTGPGYSFQLERNNGGTWVRLPTTYTVSPPSYSRDVAVDPGEYRAQCFGGPNNTDSTSPPRTVRDRPQAEVITRPSDTYTSGRFETLVKGVRIPKKDRNKYMKPKYRVLCRPLKSANAGEVTYCKYRVTKKGGLKVKVIGNKPVRVVAIITVRPKPKYRKDYAPIVKKERWILRPKKK